MSRNQSVAIRIEELHLAFGDTAVLKGIDLQIEPGELFAFLGPSGSGKSTLLRAIAGFGPMPRGRILLDGEEIGQLPPWRRNVGMVFQSYALWPHMTVRRNVAFGLEERRLPKAEIRRRVDEALTLVGLLDLADRRPGQLSGGQQQRIALARTLVVEPRVLLLDEPLSNLDANLRVQMRREILDLQRKLSLTTIFVTHDQEEANTIADRMAVLDQGVIQQVGTPMALYDNPVNRFVADFLGTANVLPGQFQRAGGDSRFTGEQGFSLLLHGSDRSGPGAILFRPQNLTIGGAAVCNGDGVAQINGTVRHREFLGSLTRYEVECAGARLLVDDNHQRGEPPYDPGTQIELTLDAAQVVPIDA